MRERAKGKGGGTYNHIHHVSLDIVLHAHQHLPRNTSNAFSYGVANAAASHTDSPPLKCGLVGGVPLAGYGESAGILLIPDTDNLNPST